jgi:murein DD-endopeptidase MepM/ murein hydrolase activator NlpD
VPNRVVLDEPTWVVLDLAPKRRPGQWIHPVASATEKLPEARSRRFGASRPGKRPGHCRRGHCGVDLTGPRGTPIVAVLPGTVTRVERSRRKRSGRYVKIEHTDGSATSYMHLDRIAPGLAEGQKVDAGHMLGTLGRTGIRRSDPHLHFQLEVPRGRYHRYVDPEPMLNEAVVIDVIDIQLAKTE